MNNILRCVLIISCLVISTAVAKDTLKESGSDEFQILLCSDSGGVDDIKYVYTYIDGKKTECMPKYKLLQKISDTKEERIPDSLKKADKYSAGYDKITLIKMGKKDFKGANFSGMDLMGLDLSGAVFKNADFTSSDMRNVIICNADLRGADFQAAFLKGADFSGSDLSGTSFSGAYLQRAVFKNIKSLSLDSLLKAKTLYQAEIDSLTYERLKERNPGLFKDPESCWSGNRWSKDTECSRDKKVDTHPR